MTQEVLPEQLDFTASFISLLAFCGTFFAAYRYLDPWKEYFRIVELSEQVRKMWTRYESELLLPRENLQAEYFKALKSLETQAGELAELFIPGTINWRFQFKAWAKILHVKTLSRRIHVFKVTLQTVCEQHRRIRESLADEESEATLYQMNEDVFHLAKKLIAPFVLDGSHVLSTTSNFSGRCNSRFTSPATNIAPSRRNTEQSVLGSETNSSTCKLHYVLVSSHF
ncbi:hypothetical protein CPB83DRAFT_890512 [Crepidotus variabilis]|uniref:Uncharacterized protein n=1 Tax=Crepidotus variabilis TaxID=179855 RepID=A0A9P6EPS3_9AGAR|nr:hypothetical protein CPB83DRAFT_890512 [Crepidotus variabilis]